MYQSWVDATAIGKETQQDPWAADFAAHPLLDPDFQRKGGRLLQLMRNNFRLIIRDDDAYRRELARFYRPGIPDTDELPPLGEMAEGAAGYLNEADIWAIAVGQEVTLTFDGLPEKALSGRVTRIAPMASMEQGGTNYTIVIELDEQDPGLRWGMTAYVDITVQ